jgi:hypothetical protein
MARQRLPKIADFSLWNHQILAVEMAQSYVRAYAKKLTTGAALVHLPTGSGKSGVIAILSRVVPGIGDVLVLTPRIALRDQLHRDLSARFFTRLGASPPPASLPKTVHLLADEPADLATLPASPCVFVATLQSFYSWHKGNRPVAQTLAARANLVVIDEGHCEPAPCWREAVRAFDKPRILCTATPYRNDLKIFDLDFDHAFCLTHGDAVSDGILRELEVVDRAVCTDVAAFVTDVLDFYDTRFGAGAGGGDPPRSIIRCDNHEQVRQIAAALQARGRTCVAVHERFSPDPANPHLRRAVPLPETEPAIFWIHQFKLLEGIDDSRFRMVAAYEPFRNARELVQQAGRVLRNPGLVKGEKAYLLDHTAGFHRRLWRGYLEYDARLKLDGVKATLEPGQRLFEAWLKGQPPGVYLDGMFRVPLDLDAFSPASGLQLPLTANVHRKGTAFDLNAVEAGMRANCLERDLVARFYRPDAKTVVGVYLVLNNSPYLRDAFYVENRLSVTVVRETDAAVFVYDPGGVVPYDAPGLGDVVPAGELKKLFRAATCVRITNVSLLNTNVAPDAVRGRSISAASVRGTLPLPDDHSSVCTRAEGYAAPTDAISAGSTTALPVRRYTGFRTGKVSDYTGGFVPLDRYNAWVDELAAVLVSAAKPVDDFRRYSGEVGPPADCTPTHILLDLGDVERAFVANGHPGAEDGDPIDLADRCAELTRTGPGRGKLALQANGSTFDLELAYEPSRKRYVLSGPGLDAYYRRSDSGTPSGLIGSLNRSQSFRVLTKTPGFFYAQGRFFHPAVQFGPDYDDEQLGVFKILHPVARLGAIGSEKGEGMAFPAGTWPADSVFGLIASLGAGTEMAAEFGNPDVVVCDDMGTESADFITADQAAHRVVFIHGKATIDEHQYAASPLQEVCGQAVKNIRYLAKFSEEGGPTKCKEWHQKPWRLDAITRPRIRRGSGTGLAVWESIRAIVRDPRSTCEVWLCLGKMFSVSKYKAALTAKNPKAEAVQAAYLLHGLMTTAAGVGARVKVWCSP